jgi:hypothetical protein
MSGNDETISPTHAAIDPWRRPPARLNAHASRRLIHQMQKPLKTMATPAKMASSSHWNIQKRLAG